MKNILIIFLIIIASFSTASAKLTPDTDRVSDLIQKKQEEIKDRMIKQIIRDHVMTTNTITYNTFDNILTSLIEEKNKQAMAIDILTEFSRYSIVMTIAENFTNSKKLIKVLDRNLASTNIYDNLSQGFSEVDQKFGFTAPGGGDGKKRLEGSKQSKSIRLLQNFIIDKITNRLIFNHTKNKSIGTIWSVLFGNRYKQGFDSSRESMSGLIKPNEQILVNEINKYVDTIVINLYNEAAQIGDLAKLLKGIYTLKTKKDFFNLLQNKLFIDDLFRVIGRSLAIFENNVLENKVLFIVGDLFYKYTLLTEDTLRYEIDVEAIILALGEKYTKYTLVPIQDCWFGIDFFFDIGINYGFAPTTKLQTLLESQGGFPDLKYVSEKIGFKFVLYDLSYTRSHDKGEWFKYKGDYIRWEVDKSDPYISNVHLVAYHAGFVYHIVDLISNKNFNYSQFGFGLGFTWFNDLTTNISIAFPYGRDINSLDNSFINFGLDIPIIEYLGGE